MRPIPAVLDDSVISTAEVRVHDAFRAITDPQGDVLHSLNLPEHDYKLTGELDFVVVLSDVILAVEVKGAAVSCNGGIWTYSDRHGHVRTSREGPFKQVESGMYALRDRLEKLLGKERLRTVAFGCMVVTPDTNLPASVEYVVETYVGHTQFRRPDGLAAGVERARRYWRARQSWTRPLGALRAEILTALRPEFERVPGLLARADSLDAGFERLTDEQLARLDVVMENPRVYCVGGAGTGKTFLAVEVARRAARTGRRVALVCRSPFLAAFMRGRVAVRGVTTCTLDDLTNETFDDVVVDEAQDLMTVELAERLNAAVAGGIENGRWTMFLDPNSQTHVYGEFDDDVYGLIQQYGVRATLSRNCRNTREIVFQTRAYTGADVGVAAAGSGPEVVVVQSEGVEDEAALLGARLRDLTAEDVPAGEITLLSVSGDWERTSARLTRDARRGRIRQLDLDTAARWPVRELTWAAAEDFKGFENRFVCVIDVERLESRRDASLLYVALSRARAGLWMAVRGPAADELARLYDRYGRGALEALGGARS